MFAGLPQAGSVNLRTVLVAGVRRVPGWSRHGRARPLKSMKTFAPLADPESVFPILSDIALFGGMSERQLSEVCRWLEQGSFAQGEHIFQKGDDPSHIYIVTRGKIDLLIVEHGLALQKKTLTAGDCFGEASLMSMQRHAATAIAREDSDVIVLSKRALLRLQKEDAALFSLLMMNIARELARRLRLTDDILLRLMRNPDSG
jgi:CRP/FNR family cyclic AMP-dependent transcriptional regulator